MKLILVDLSFVDQKCFSVDQKFLVDFYFVDQKSFLWIKFLEDLSFVDQKSFVMKIKKLF